VFKDLRDTLLDVTRQHCDGVVPVDYHGTTGNLHLVMAQSYVHSHGPMATIKNFALMNSVCS
jgi:hypothetical protein